MAPISAKWIQENAEVHQLPPSSMLSTFFGLKQHVIQTRIDLPFKKKKITFLSSLTYHTEKGQGSHIFT